MVELRKINIVAEIPFEVKRLKVPDEVPFTAEDGKIIGTAKLEKTKSGNLIVHIDAQEIPEAITRGFSLKGLSIAEAQYIHDEVQRFTETGELDEC